MLAVTSTPPSPLGRGCQSGAARSTVCPPYAYCPHTTLCDSRGCQSGAAPGVRDCQPATSPYLMAPAASPYLYAPCGVTLPYAPCGVTLPLCPLRRHPTLCPLRRHPTFMPPGLRRHPTLCPSCNPLAHPRIPTRGYSPGFCIDRVLI